MMSRRLRTFFLVILVLIMVSLITIGCDELNGDSEEIYNGNDTEVRKW